MEDQAVTAALVGVAMGLIEVIKKAMQRANGGSVEYRLAAMEKQMEQVTEKLSDFREAFFEFRQQTLVKWAREERDEGRD